MDFAAQAENIRKITERYVTYIGIDVTGVLPRACINWETVLPGSAGILLFPEVETASGAENAGRCP